MKPVDVKSDSYPEYKPKSKVGDHVRFQNTKTFFLRNTRKIGQQKFLLLVKLRIQFCGHTWLVTWMVTKLLEVFMKKNCKKLAKKKIRIEKKQW